MKQKKPPKPKDTPKTPMPSEEDIEKERRRKMAEVADRSGRASTILSDAGAGAETLG